MGALPAEPKKYVLKEGILYHLTKKEKYQLKDKSEVKKIKGDSQKDIFSKERCGMREKLDIQITGKCNLKCAHCYLGEKEKKDIPIKILKKVFDSAESLGIYHIVLTGGEPLLHERIEKIIEYLNKKRFRITIVTNGSLIKERLNFLKGKIYEAVVSLDGFKKDYEKIRGFDFKKIIENIKLLRKNNINLRINAILHKNLLVYYKKFLKFVKKNFNCEIAFLPIACSGFAKENSWLFGNYEKIGKLIRKLGGSDKSDCKFYYRNLAISYKGFVYPCQFFREIDSYRLGNIFEEDLAKMIQEIDSQQIIPKTDGSACINCKFKNKCGTGCRGRAMAYNYDPNTRDPLWHDFFSGKKTKKEFFPEMKNPLYEKLPYEKYPKPTRLYQEVEKILDTLQGEKILEIGCGTGDFLSKVAKKNPTKKYVGIDISKNMIKKAKLKERENLSFRVASIHNIKEKYDITLAVYSFFNHFKTKEEIKSFFEKLKKITKWFLFDINNYELFPNRAIIKDSFGGWKMKEFVKQVGEYVYSFRKYNKGKKYYYHAMSWPKINWEEFLSEEWNIKRKPIGKRIIYLLDKRKI